MSITATATGVRVVSMAERGKPAGVIAQTLRVPQAAVLAILRADAEVRREAAYGRPLPHQGRAA